MSHPDILEEMTGDQVRIYQRTYAKLLKNLVLEAAKHGVILSIDSKKKPTEHITVLPGGALDMSTFEEVHLLNEITAPTLLDLPSSVSARVAVLYRDVQIRDRQVERKDSFVYIPPVAQTSSDPLPVKPTHVTVKTPREGPSAAEETIPVVPYYWLGTHPLLVSPSAATLTHVMIAGVSIPTMPLQFDQDINLIDVSTHAALIEAGVQTDNDTLGPTVSIGSITVRIGEDVFECSLEYQPTTLKSKPGNPAQIDARADVTLQILGLEGSRRHDGRLTPEMREYLATFKCININVSLWSTLTWMTGIINTEAIVKGVEFEFEPEEGVVTFLPKFVEHMQQREIELLGYTVLAQRRLNKD